MTMFVYYSTPAIICHNEYLCMYRIRMHICLATGQPACVCSGCHVLWRGEEISAYLWLTLHPSAVHARPTHTYIISYYQHPWDRRKCSEYN